MQRVLNIFVYSLHSSLIVNCKGKAMKAQRLIVGRLIKPQIDCVILYGHGHGQWPFSTVWQFELRIWKYFQSRHS